MNKCTVGQSMFLGWFEANKKFPAANLLTYIEMPTKFVWKKDSREWHPRKKGFSIGRIFYVPPGTGELYYMRCLLNIVCGPKCFQDLRTFNGVEYETFRDACYARGLLDDDKEYIDAFEEASHWSSAQSMRKLFVTLLTTNSMNRPEVVWGLVWQHLAEDANISQRRLLQNNELILNDDDKKNFALIEIERLLQVLNRSLKEFPPMPLPNFDSSINSGNRLLYEELDYDRHALAEESVLLASKLTNEQRVVYDSVIEDAMTNKGGMFFVYGYGRTGKTFVWKALSATLRSKGEIALNVASSGIASLLLPGGRTAHSRFAIPISITEDSTCNIRPGTDLAEDSTCNIRPGTDLAELIIRARLIIWDEAPMMHKYCFEALDRTMRDLLRFVNPRSAYQTFGGKTVVLGGDFRQILPVVPKGTRQDIVALPVVPKGTRQDIVAATINSSYLWDNCKVLKLTKNLRLNTIGDAAEFEKLDVFAKWIASIGDGTIGEQEDGFPEIDIPSNMLLSSKNDPIATIVQSTFPMFSNEIVDHTFFRKSCNSSTNPRCEFLNGIRASGIPNHSLTLKVGSPIMLLRNIDHSLGLCNGTRLIVTQLSEHVIEAKISTGDHSGTRVLVPRMTMTPSDPKLPFKFKRRQFPVMLSYAMTINKSQGQTLSHVGLLLKKPVFVHGQLYVAASRVSNPNGLKFLICDELGSTTKSTTNVVYKEVFNNL
ncbi:ATP-dependent DNA helicase PIF1-like [Ipomoea triloba]|uniref:ATP-dependent DNA helicase PIF1-like n=1 Tax=Ipomoea triloba TaxID=35885 RepID=UPI00125D9D75|nr:ATP-dependent DNA helicase PIF1-like [Ipomoea triloba]